MTRELFLSGVFACAPCGPAVPRVAPAPVRYVRRPGSRQDSRIRLRATQA
jgi:hypothetical protein